MDQQQLASTVGATLVQLQRKGVSATIRHFSGEAADAVRGPPCALQIRRQLMTAWPWRLRSSAAPKRAVRDALSNKPFRLGTAISLHALGTAQAWPELVCRPTSGDPQ